MIKLKKKKRKEGIEDQKLSQESLTEDVPGEDMGHTPKPWGQH